MDQNRNSVPGNSDDGGVAPFNVVIRVSDADTGISATDYLNALDLHVKGPLHRASFELSELICNLPKEEMKIADDYLSIQRAAFIVWEQIDKEVLEDFGKKEGRRNSV